MLRTIVENDKISNINTIITQHCYDFSLFQYHYYNKKMLTRLLFSKQYVNRYSFVDIEKSY